MLDAETREQLRGFLAKLNVHIEDRHRALDYVPVSATDSGVSMLVRQKAAVALTAWLGAKNYLIEALPELKDLEEAKHPVAPKQE